MSSPADRELQSYRSDRQDGIKTEPLILLDDVVDVASGETRGAIGSKPIVQRDTRGRVCSNALHQLLVKATARRVGRP